MPMRAELSLRHWLSRYQKISREGWHGRRQPASDPLELGWPRTIRSLCPVCTKTVRDEILAGQRDPSVLREPHHPGQLPALLHERDGSLWLEKDCPVHGHFEEELSHDPEFMRVIERRFFPRERPAPKSPLRDHGCSSIVYGRGAVLTVDLTNRCNMRCEPCFMDANQVGYVHELPFSTIEKILDDALSIEPKRQLSIQFSGGEPTLSPHFLEAIRAARERGFFCVQCATNGIAFAQDPSLAERAKKAGLRLAYLQFDGLSERDDTRGVSNLFSVKQRAIENLHRAGIDVVLVVTVIRGHNHHEVGDIVRFAIDNIDKITVVSFQPIAFAGREEDVDLATRKAERYTLTHLAHDLKDQLHLTEPTRDWFPLSAMQPLSALTDRLQDVGAPLGALHCGCHPHCGVGTVLLVHKRDRRVVPLCDILDVEGLLSDLDRLSQSELPRPLLKTLTGLCVLRRFRAAKAPSDYGVFELVRQLLSQIGARGGRVGQSAGDAAEFPWRFLFVAGMWFQDLYTFDFDRTERCIIPYGTEEGEISFCAYNSGVGFRQVVEKNHFTATNAEWHRRHGRHPIYAKGAEVPLPEGPGEPSRAAVRRHLRLVS